ncbi:MAG: helix-turn-helix domain-containing protein [Lentisphaeraceae bacterium]|nr:helix-turn-helix domain-containing protein [Lentisphaeraceae bacterium]
MNEEENSVQQNLPLSWDDSEQNLEQAEAPKKLLLKREPTEEPQEETSAPKPLLLKRAQPEETQEENAELEHEEEAEYNEPSETDEDYENYEAQLDEALEETEEPQAEAPAPKPLLLKRPQPTEDSQEESAEIEHEVEDILDEEDTQEESAEIEHEDENQIDDNHEIDYSEYDEEFDEKINDDNQEISSAENEIDISEKYEEEQSLAALIEKEDSSLDESGTPLFQETGTFSLKHNPEEDESDRLEIEDGILDNIEEPSENHSQNDISEETPKKELSAEDINAEESVFALKADTYYEVESTGQEAEPETAEPEADESIYLDNTVTHETIHTLGALLQDARLAKSYTIKDASDTTRIKNSYIIALENNDLNELPAKVYILNYIRQLAREYDIPHAPLIDAYEKQVGDSENGEQHFIRVGDDEARKATKPGGKLNTIIVATMLLLFTAFIFLAYYKKWLSPQQSLQDHPGITISLEDLKEEIALPTPELPVPGGQ